MEVPISDSPDPTTAPADATAATTDASAVPVDASAVTTDASAAPAEAPAESLFPPFDFEAFPSHLFWLIIAFGLLYFVVNRLIVPQVGGIIEDRRDRIASDLGEASRLSRETDEVISIYEHELTEARQKAYGIAQQRRDEIKAEQERQQAETEAALEARIADAEKQIATRRDAALSDVDAIATEATTAIIDHIGGLDVTKADISAAVKRREAADA